MQKYPVPIIQINGYFAHFKIRPYIGKMQKPKLFSPIYQTRAISTTQCHLPSYPSKDKARLNVKLCKLGFSPLWLK
jgi:hypothetical protein